jgi:putative molybdopterin biosynthesis protein
MNTPLRKHYLTEKEFIICGQDALLDILSRHLERHQNGVRVLRSYVGSYNGLYALYHGNASIATAHLWDGDTGEYNIPYIRRLLPGIPSVVIHIACRIQGFYVSKGNPKKIKEWQDLTRADVLMINREKGSGTRVLLDESLRRLNIPSWSVRGYDWEELSHLAVASTVARGDADVGIGNEKAAMQVSGIDFIPLQKEKYDMVIKKEDMNLPHVQAIIEILNSKEFKAELQGIGGYDLDKTGSIVTEI